MSTSRAGTRGLLFTDLAEGRGEGAFTVAATQDVFWAENLLARGHGDSDLFSRTRLAFAWDPVAHLQVAASGAFVSNIYQDFYRLSRRQLGSPEVSVKGYFAPSSRLGLGLVLGASMPTAPSGASLAAAATSPHARLLMSLRPSERWVLVANLTGVYDRSAALLAPPVSGEQRLTFGIWDGPHVGWSLGGQGLMRLTSGVDLAAFAEARQEVVLSRSQPVAPPRLAGGVRAVVGRRARLELMLAADGRLGAGLGDGAGQPAPPPWRAFASLALHLDYGRRPAAAAAVAPAAIFMTRVDACAQDLDCPLGLSCRDGRCAVVTASVAATPPLVVEGLATDAESGRPISEAIAEVSGHHDTRVKVDSASGRFLTWGLSGERDVDITVSAPRYLPLSRRFSPAFGDRLVRAAFALRPDPKFRPMTLRGVLRDRARGHGLRGTLAVTSGAPQHTRADGSFEVQVAPGRHALVFSAPGYLAQKKVLDGRAGALFILNIDLEAISPRD